MTHRAANPDHKESSTAVLEYLRRHQFMILLLSLVFLMLCHPITAGVPRAEVALYLMFNVLLVVSLIVLSRSRTSFIFGIILGVPALIGSWTQFSARNEDFSSVSGIDIVAQIAMVSFLMLVAWTLMRRVFSGREVTADHLYGSASAYLLLGLVWGYTYVAIETASPGAFHMDPDLADGELLMGRMERSSILFYYSFVTLTTLGFGDITPQTPIARTLTMCEAISGQVYLTILVARLVGLHISSGLSKDDG